MSKASTIKVICAISIVAAAIPVGLAFIVVILIMHSISSLLEGMPVSQFQKKDFFFKKERNKPFDSKFKNDEDIKDAKFEEIQEEGK